VYSASVNLKKSVLLNTFRFLLSHYLAESKFQIILSQQKERNYHFKGVRDFLVKMFKNSLAVKKPLKRAKIE